MGTQAFQDAVEQVKTATPEEAPEAETEENTEEETPEIEELEFEDSTEETPTVEMPNSWSKDDTEHWEALTPEGQEFLSKREREQRSESSRRQNELSDREKVLNERDEKTKQKQAEIVETLKALKIQKPSADLLDENHESHNPDEYHRQNAAYEKSLSKVEDAEKELYAQQNKDFAEWRTVQAGHYKEKWPEFLDIEAGPKLHNELIAYTSKEMGISMEAATQSLQTTNFHQMSILNKAMRYDLAIANAKAKKGKPKSKSLKGGASNPKKSENKDVKALAAAFNKSRSPADAAALLGANKG